MKKTETCIHLQTIESMEKAIKRYHEERSEDPLFPFLVGNAEAAITHHRNNHRRFCKETS